VKIHGIGNIKKLSLNAEVKLLTNNIIIIIIIIIKVQRIKSKQLDHWQYQYLDIVLEPENKETTNHSWTASPKSRCRSLVCP